MQNVLIGENLGGCAIVCGSLSFLDKISCGLALGRILAFNVFVVNNLRFWRKPRKCIVFIDVLGLFLGLGLLIAKGQMSGRYSFEAKLSCFLICC